MDQARIQLENKEYHEMTRNISQGTNPLDSSPRTTLSQDIQELRKLSRQIIAITNVLFSIVATFVAVYVFWERVSSDAGMKVLAALVCCFVVALAEGWFFTRDWLLS